MITYTENVVFDQQRERYFVRRSANEPYRGPYSRRQALRASGVELTPRNKEYWPNPCRCLDVTSGCYPTEPGSFEQDVGLQNGEPAVRLVLNTFTPSAPSAPSTRKPMTTPEMITAVLEREPDLVQWGFYCDFMEGSWTSLLDDPSNFERALHWIYRCARSKALNRKLTSYGWKHIAEKEAGYLSNGTFIGAAIALGVPYRRTGPDNPNAFLSLTIPPRTRENQYLCAFPTMDAVWKRDFDRVMQIVHVENAL